MRSKEYITISNYKKTVYKTPEPILTGWHGFDTASFGFFKGELSVFGGRPSTGKTDFLIRLALWLEQSEKNSVFLSPRQDLDLLLSKFDNFIAKDNEKFQRKQVERIQLYLKEKILVESIDQIITESIEERDEIILIIDNFTSLETEIEFQKEHYKIQYIMQMLKECTLKHKIPIVTSVGLNRKVDFRSGEKRPFLSDLRGSGEIEELADKVGLIYRPMFYGITEFDDGTSTAGITEVKFAKNSFGKPRSFMYNNHLSNEESFDSLEYNFENLM